MTLPERLFDCERAVEALGDDTGWTIADMDGDEQIRIYMLREKLDKIIAGDERQAYGCAYRKWRRANNRKVA